MGCSPFGVHNTSKLHLINREDGDIFKNRIRKLVCPKCGREYTYESDNKKGHTLTRCNSCAINERRFKIKEKAVNYKGGKCEKCSYDKCISALDFHHVNEEEKEFNLSGCHCYAWKRIEKELDKCILVCSNCHREIHAGL